jgi:DNA mismatch repair protein MutS
VQLAFVPPAASPIRRQYLSIKQQHPDAILFFQLGDFYETFEEDARTVSQVCDIALTTREMGRGERVPMAGVPIHAADVYVGRLVERGHHIAIAEQVEPAAKSGGGPALVRREVTRVITPGTLLDPTLLKATSSNFLAAVVLAGQRIGIAHADISTGSFACVEIDGRDAREVARSELARILPAECLAVDEDAARALLPPNTPVTAESALFAASSADRALCNHFGVASVEALGLAPGSGAGAAAAAVLRYVERTHARAVSSLERLQLYDPRGHMVIDPATRDHLEIARGAGGQRAGSLLHALDRTRTAMGARLLAEWLGHPLLDRKRIERRLDGVGALVELRTLRIEAQATLADMPDLERLAGRAAQQLLSPRAALTLADALELAARHRATLSLMPEVESRQAPIVDRIDPPMVVATDIRETIVEDPAAAFGEGVIATGRITELDELRSLSSDGRQWLVELERRERQRTGLKNLKVGYNRVFGYYLEVPTSTLNQPLDYYREQETSAKTTAELLDHLGYQRRQTLASVERFVTAELREHEVKQARSSTRMAELEREAHEQLCARIAQESERLLTTAVAIADLDVLASLAEVAEERRYVRPEIADEPITEIVRGRHPVVETMVGWDLYIPSDVHLAGRVIEEAGVDEGEVGLTEPAPSVVLLTGPNMAGKTTYGRMSLLIALMGQCGSFVPADRARLGLVDRIFLRSGAGDDIAGGRSTFMVEMTETAAILRGATGRSLIFFDEVGRGTSTYDGMAIARAIVEYLAHPDRACRTIFSTHYHELAAMESDEAIVRNYHTEVREAADQVAFTYRVVPGSADRSYGVHVARLAGLPASVIARAAEELRRLEQGRPERAAPTGPTESPAALPPVLHDLVAIDVDRLTPIEALTLLATLRDAARRLLDSE